jgi:Flp pilus assembly pilin Flp
MGADSMTSLYTRFGLLLMKAYSLFLVRVRDQEGQELVEYAMVLAFIMILVLTATRFLGGKVSGEFTTLANSI